MWIGHNGELVNFANVVKIDGRITPVITNIDEVIYQQQEPKTKYHAVIELTSVRGTKAEFAKRSFTDKHDAERYVANVLEMLRAMLKAEKIKEAV